MRILLVPLFLGLLSAQIAAAEPYWAQIGLTASATNAPKVAAAVDKLMTSEVGKTFPGRMLLQVNVADGSDPTTHTVVPIYHTAADREQFMKRLLPSAEWKEFQATLEKLGSPGGTILYRNLRSWGDINDTDTLWMAHAFSVSDPAAFVAAMNAFMNSPTGKKGPGQVYLSSVLAGGIGPVSHVVSVGYASLTEMAAWLTMRDASADWATFMQAGGKAGAYLGATLASDLKTWVPMSMKQVVAP